MALNTIKFSAFQAATLTNTTNMLVGVSWPSGGDNFQQPATVMWTDATRPGDTRQLAWKDIIQLDHNMNIGTVQIGFNWRQAVNRHD